MHSLVTPIFPYACEFRLSQQSCKEEYEPWKWDAKAIYIYILGTLCKDHKKICATIQQAIRPHKDLLTIVKRCKLKWYGDTCMHISHSSGLAKTVLQGTEKGERRQGRQKKWWEDNIKKRTGLKFTKSKRTVENRENGRYWLWSHLWRPNDPHG